MKDASALVTGATAGIGYEISRALARDGMSVVITGRDEQRGRAAVAELRREANHDGVEFIAVDHSTIGANQQLAEDLGERLDRLNVLVNNIGRVFSRREQTADGYEATLALNFLAPFALTARLRPLLLASAPARIVNVASSAFKMWKRDPLVDLQSRERYVGISAHAHAKLLNVIWTLALARELEGTGVSANALNPGAAWTPGIAALTPEAVPAWRFIWPLVRFFQRRGSAEKAARTPIWLATDPAAAALNGGYFENKKPKQLPEVALNRDQQERVVDVARELIAKAPTAALAPTSRS